MITTVQPFNSTITIIPVEVKEKDARDGWAMD